MRAEGVIAAVLAAGYGSITSHSKLIELLDEKRRLPIITQVVHTVYQLGVPPFVVLNNLYGDEIKETLFYHHRDLFVCQPDRTGTAGAVQVVLQSIKGNKLWSRSKHLLVLHGDMPLWTASTISMLIDSHINSTLKPAISMFAVLVNDNCPETVKSYGRIIENKNGEIIDICEPREFDGFQPIETAGTYRVNPSAWVFDMAWMKEVIFPLDRYLKPHDNGDGHTHEFWLIDLVPLAVKQGRKINKVLFDDPWQALGVNTARDLKEAQEQWKKRNTMRGVI